MATSGYRWLLLGKTPPIEWFCVVKRQMNYCDYKQYSGWFK